MVDGMNKIVGKTVGRVKKKLYGRTFACPVCHLDLSYHDVNEDGLLVCPLCGVVIELADVFGHAVPVVHDVEIKRAQPKARLHPLSTHLPVGLFPFALLGSLFLLALSLARQIMASTGYTLDNSLLAYLPVVRNVSAFMLVIAVAFSVITLVSGLWDWKYRYGGRRYRMITLKIWFSVLFIALGIIAIVLHTSNAVFDCCTGMIAFTLPSLIFAFLYFVVMFINMIVIATLGHVGGNLVLGK